MQTTNHSKKKRNYSNKYEVRIDHLSFGNLQDLHQAWLHFIPE